MCFRLRQHTSFRAVQYLFFLDIDLFWVFFCFSLPQEHTWQMKPKEQTTRLTPTQPSSMLRATMHTQKKRKNTSFRLQRELCSSLPPLFLFQSLYPFFSLSVSSFSSPPLTSAPVMTTRNPQAVYRKGKFPNRFPVIAFCWAYFYHLHLVLYLFLLFFFFFLAASFHRQLANAVEVVPFVIFFLIFDMNSWRSVYLSWLLLTLPLVRLLCCIPPSRHPNTYDIPFVHTHPQTHIILHINTVPKKYRRHWTSVNAFMYRLSVAM